MNRLFILIFSIFATDFCYAVDCTYLDEGCSPNASCYTQRLPMSCTDGRTGYVDDQTIPDKILGRPNTKKLRLVDIIRNSGKAVISFSNDLIVFNESFGEFTLTVKPNENNKYDCMWAENPKIVMGRCHDAQPVCTGKVVCTDKHTKISIGGLSACLVTSAGGNCNSASNCVSAQDQMALVKSLCQVNEKEKLEIVPRVELKARTNQ